MTSVIVIGGGIAGLGVALGLARRGVEVTVLDRSKAGSGASLNNAGWVSPVQTGPLPHPGVIGYGMRALFDPRAALFVAPAYLPRILPWLTSFALHSTASRHLAGTHALMNVGYRSFPLLSELIEAGYDLPIAKSGLVAAADSLEAVEAFVADAAPAASFGAEPAQIVTTSQQLHELEPALSDDVRAGALLVDNWQIDPGAFMPMLVRAAQDLGVQILEGQDVLDVTPRRLGTVRVRTQLGWMDTSAAVLAAGAWTPPLARSVGWRVPLIGAKGYSFEVDAEVPPRRPIIFTDAHVAVVPAHEGARLVGTLEMSGTNLRIDARRVDAILAAARPRLRGLGARPRTDPWVGLRPLLPDGLPLADGDPERGIWIATGYSMLGMTVGLPIGDSLAEWMTTGHRPAVLEPFARRRSWAGLRDRR